jgi:hypothetical protein
MRSSPERTNLVDNKSDKEDRVSDILINAGYVPICNDTKPGTMMDGELPVVEGTPIGTMGFQVKGTSARVDGSDGITPTMLSDMIKPLIAMCINASALVLAELHRVRPIKLENWPFPKGFRTRVGPAYFAYIYAEASRAVDYGLRWLKDHGLESCAIARENLTIFQQWDDYLLQDCLTGFINTISFERGARKCLGNEGAFESCRTISDWLRPKEGTPGRKDWTSKVNWRAAQRIDGELVKRAGFRYEPMDREIRGELEHDALVTTATAKMDSILGPGSDLINIHP